MHISEGVLSPEILVTGTVLSLGFLIFATKRLRHEEIPLVAVFTALFFVASFIHVPIGPASIHLVLSGIIGALLGVRVFIAIAIALFLQGLLFGYGGVTTLGINTFNLAFPALFASFIMRIKVDKLYSQKIKFFLVGFIPILFSSLFLCISLALNGEAFLSVAKLVFITQIPLMIVEGIISMFALLFLQKVYPELLRREK